MQGDAKNTSSGSNGFRTWRNLGISALKFIPANMGMVQNFMKAVNWKQAHEEVLRGLNNTVVIVGQPNTGKSTLFNKLKGEVLSPVSAEAGTTRSLIRTDFGPFTLIDTPGIDSPAELSDITQSGLQQASVIVLLIDGSKELQAKDKELYEVVSKLEKPVIIAVNKVDVLKGKQGGDRLASEIAAMLDVPGVIPISAKTGLNVVEELIPGVIEASPEAALVIGRELPYFRRQAARRIIRNAALLSLAAGIEPIPLVDIPILLGLQVRLVLRIAALYGESMNSAETMKHARELMATMVGGLGMRYLAEQAAKAVPFGGDIVAGAIAGAATWSIGEVALEYYEGGKQINIPHLRQLFNDVYRSFRKERNADELRRRISSGAGS
ncbi:MAG: 50S ribosome-binding GTPase [Ktedonobacteraceae bacterium]|nr:50S ribosome-binding GTPase [Ktedonobacteraceae bacterium]